MPFNSYFNLITWKYVSGVKALIIALVKSKAVQKPVLILKSLEQWSSWACALQMLPVFCSFSKISNLFVCSIEVVGKKIDMFRDVSCYGNTTAVPKEHRLWTYGMWSWWFFTDVKCFAMALNRINVLCCSVCTRCISCCVRRQEQQLHALFFFFFPGVIWNAGDRCVAFYNYYTHFLSLYFYNISIVWL